jgi:Fe-S-cluster containining protein
MLPEIVSPIDRELMESLKNYRTLVERVDALAQRIETEFRAQIACRRGCDACCRHLSLFWVEGVALAQALDALPETAAERIRERGRRAAADGPCPLLEDGVCLLYAARPIICRTHGLPLLAGEGEARRIDYCPENFRGIDTLPAGAVLDLDRLNTTLTAVNALFVSEVFHGQAPEQERLAIAEALLLEL